MGKNRRQHTTNSMQYAVGRKIEFCLLLTPCLGDPPGRPYPLLSNKGGFSLMEIVIVLAIMGLMAGALTPIALHLIESKKAFANRDELQALKKAMIGDPLATQWGSEATFGYIGDIGSLPTSLQDLYTQPVGVPLFSFNTTLKIGAGWRGPYVAEKSYSSSAESLQDPYKNTYSYFTTITTDATQGIEVRPTSSDAGLLPDSTDATLGAEVLLTIRSPGPNRTDDGGTQDDLTERVLTTEVLANMAGMIKNSEGAGVPTVSVTINYPSGGTFTSSTTQTNIEGRYLFSEIPIGERSITLSPELVYVPGTAYAGIDAGADLIIGTADDLQEVEFQVANLSSNKITLQSIEVYCCTSPTVSYGEVKINDGVRDVPVSPRGLLNQCIKETILITSTVTPVDFTNLSVNCSSIQMYRAFRVLLQSSRMETPDIGLDVIGADGTLKIELLDLALTDGNPVNMAGIPFGVVINGYISNCLECGPEDCTDGIDNDGDGLIDCDDPDCIYHPACVSTVEICTNGLDDDGDGLIDCSDPDCVCRPPCSTHRWAVLFTPQRR